MHYQSIAFLLTAALVSAVPTPVEVEEAAALEARAAPAPLPTCKGNTKTLSTSDFDDKKAGATFLTAPAVGTDGKLSYPNWRVFNPLVSTIKPLDGRNVAITGNSNLDSTNPAQILPADSTVQRFSLTRLSAGCASIDSLRAAPCTIKFVAKKAQKDSSGHTVTTERELSYTPGSVLNLQLESALTNVLFTDNDKFSDITSVVVSVIGQTQNVYIAIDDVESKICGK